MKLLQTASTLLAFAGLAQACLLPEERAGGHFQQTLARRAASNGKAVGKTNRFSSTFPKGIGSGSPSDMTTILNVTEVNTGIAALVKEYGVTSFATPYKTFEGRTVMGLKVGGSGSGADTDYHIYLNGGIHARERTSHDSVLYFISDLLYANKQGTGLTYGKNKYTNAQVEQVLGAGIVAIPLSNPDGTNYDQISNSCWRKNRNTKSGSSGASVGIDLNRNFDFAWDLSEWASSEASSVASNSPSSEVFHGTAAFSEPESKNMKYVLDTFTAVRWYIDLHSYAGDVLYSWGSDTDQSTQPYKNFLNATYDSIRGITSDSTTSKYGEYISTADLDNIKTVGSALGGALSSAAGRSYTLMQSAYLYPTSGASDDYAFSRYFADNTKNKVYSYTVEFGFSASSLSCPFYVTDSTYTSNLQETGSGFMDFVLAAIDVGLQ